MASELNQTMAQILEETAALPKDELELLRTALQEDSLATLDQLLVNKQTLAPEEAKQLREKARTRLGLPEVPGYSIIGKLGEGGMGAVYHAIQNSMQRPVALKILSAERARDQGFVDRFYREARSSAVFDHPNVVRGFDVGEVGDGSHYFAMEYIEGQNVQDILDEKGKLLPGDALRIVYDVALALEHAKECNLIHRDIKPANILVTKKGVIKLADLGLAKQMDDENSSTQTGSGFGTPYYMPPEQARDAKHVDGRSDIYALGATLYHMLTGKQAFKGDTALEILLNKEKGTFPSASSINPEVPAKLNVLIDKMMAKDPAHRFQSATELLETLDKLEIHHSQLTWIDGAGTSRTPSRGTRPATATSAAKPTAGKPQKAGTQKAVQPTDPNTWFVHYIDPSGKAMKVKMDMSRMLQLIRDEVLTEKAEASRSPKGPFKKLATYPEFSSMLNARVARRRIEKKSSQASSQYSDLVANIDDAQRAHRRNKKIKDIVWTASTWVLAACIVGGGGYWIWKSVGASGASPSAAAAQPTNP